MKLLIARFARNQDGAVAIEYGLILALVAVAIIPAADMLGKALRTVLSTVANQLN